MKKSIVMMGVLCIIGLATLKGQVPVVVNFNSTNTGRSIDVLASKIIDGRHELGGGLCFNINKQTANDDQSNVYRKRLYAGNPWEFFGAEGFYQVHFLKNLPHVDLFAFYDIQYRFAHTRFSTHPTSGVYSTFGPFHWIEQNVGLGFSVDIWKNLFLIQRLGGGVSFIVGKDKPHNPDGILKTQQTVTMLDYLYTVGLGYRF